jgi:hypothetical protein
MFVHRPRWTKMRASAARRVDRTRRLTFAFGNRRHGTWTGGPGRAGAAPSRSLRLIPWLGSSRRGSVVCVVSLDARQCSHCLLTGAWRAGRGVVLCFQSLEVLAVPEPLRAAAEDNEAGEEQQPAGCVSVVGDGHKRGDVVAGERDRRKQSREKAQQPYKPGGFPDPDLPAKRADSAEETYEAQVSRCAGGDDKNGQNRDYDRSSRK